MQVLEVSTETLYSGNVQFLKCVVCVCVSTVDVASMYSKGVGVEPSGDTATASSDRLERLNYWMII